MAAPRKDRRKRIADNEGRFRALNDRLGRDLQPHVAPDEMLEFVCECGDLDCQERIELRMDEYEQIRASSRHFAVRPGHELPDAEDVLERRERFFVVEKPLAVATQLERSDPRVET
jgi:hypothetical protein